MHRPVGVIGLGIMGSAMASHLLRAGHRVAGYDPVATRREVHIQAGGDAALRARDVDAAVIICSLPSSDALIETASELVKARRPPRVVVETSTLPIAVKEKARRKLATAGTILLDCPLSGTGAQARSKDLVVYASGERAAWRRVVQVVKVFSRTQYYLGDFGSASKLKFVANLLVAIHNVAAAEALVLARRAGLDPALVLQAVSDGAGSSRVLQLRGPMMVAGDYSVPTMKLDVWKKDMSIIADFARRLGAPTPLFTASAAIYDAALDMGYHDEDTAAVHAVLAAMARPRGPQPRRSRSRLDSSSPRRRRTSRSSA
jgi:3-hydroxyisobutyrate dehydrogenase-like beta-hydroxyacid dehydrogenase